MNTETNASLIHLLKVKMTAISGYTQMLEQEVAKCAQSSEKQRVYVTNLRRITDELVQDIAQYESMNRSK